MKNKTCLYDFLKNEGYGRTTVKKIVDAYLKKDESNLKLYERRSLAAFIWIRGWEDQKEVNNETDNNQN